MACLMVPLQVQADSGLLWLVNPDHPLEADYRPEDLVNINGYLIRPEAKTAFLRMFEHMEAAGIDNVHLQSVYRPYQYQQVLFEDKVRTLIGLGYDEATARSAASHTVATPGTSEHQTGLAVDVSVNGQLDAAFGDTEAGIWLKNNSNKYGYIVRYPQDKVEITRIIYEPWHLRYVGAPHAQYMGEYNLCFEEYIQHVREAGIVLFWLDEGNYYKMSYTTVGDCETPTECNSLYLVDVSSIGTDDGDGYIVTEMKRFIR